MKADPVLSKKEEVKKPDPAPVKKPDPVPVKKEEVKKPEAVPLKKPDAAPISKDPVTPVKKEEGKVPPISKKDEPAKSIDTKSNVSALPDPSKLPAASTKQDLNKTSSSLSTKGDIKVPAEAPITAPPKT